MPRGLTLAQKATVAEKKLFRPAMFVKVDLSPTPYRAWDGVGTVNALGQDWLGVGQLGLVEGIGGERGLRSSGVNIGLHGIPTSAAASAGFITAVRAQNYRLKPMYVYMCMTHPDTDLPLCDPWLMWRGVADVMQIQTGETVSVLLPGEHYSSMLRRSNGLRMSHESHMSRTGNAADIFFRFLTRLAGKPKKIIE